MQQQFLKNPLVSNFLKYIFNLIPSSFKHYFLCENLSINNEL